MSLEACVAVCVAVSVAVYVAVYLVVCSLSSCDFTPPEPQGYYVTSL